MTASDNGTAPARRVGLELHYQIDSFLTDEADFLDRGDYQSWLSLLSPEIRYRMPVKVTTAIGAPAAVLGQMDHFYEDYYSLSKRVQRLLGEYAWTENPPSRTRRFVTNVRATHGAHDDEFSVQSNLLLFRSRLDVRPPEWVAAQRTDKLRRVDARLLLAHREINVDEAVLRTQNLAIFL